MSEARVSGEEICYGKPLKNLTNVTFLGILAVFGQNFIIIFADFSLYFTILVGRRKTIFFVRSEVLKNEFYKVNF